jgi:hypothetical protein
VAQHGVVVSLNDPGGRDCRNKIAHLEVVRSETPFSASGPAAVDSPRHDFPASLQ